MTVKTGKAVSLLDEIDNEVAEIASLKNLLAEHEETEKALKEKLIAEMLKERRHHIEFPNGFQARLFQAEVGEAFFNPSFVMNRLPGLIPFSTIINLVNFSSTTVDSLAKRGKISEVDATKLFVGGYSVRDEHIRFY